MEGMQTTNSSDSDSDSDPDSEPEPAAVPAAVPPKQPRGVGWGFVGVTLLMVLFVGLIAWGAKSCESMAGGPVRSAADFEALVVATKEAGENTASRLSLTPYANRETSTSCVDDIGFDDEGVARDQPIYTWALDFDSRHDYRTALSGLKADWREHGYQVRDLPAPAKRQPGAGLPGISTTDDHGIELTVAPDPYSGQPTVRADGGCMRYHDDYPYDHDYDGDGEPDW